MNSQEQEQVSGPATATIENSAAAAAVAAAAPAQVNLLDVKITSPMVAFQVVINFLNLAQKRGAFTIQEAGKLCECIEVFKEAETSGPAPAPVPSVSV